MDQSRQAREEEAAKLSPIQRRNIEELVQMSPPVIKSRVRRDGLSAAQVLNAYTGVPPQSGPNPPPNLKPFNPS